MESLYIFFQNFRDFEITKKDIENIWHPTIEFGHLLRYEKIKVYGGSKSFSFWYGKHWGNYYSEEFQLTFSCRFDFQNYPFDSHECHMEYGDDMWNTSYMTFNNSEIIYENKTHTFGGNPIIIHHLPFEIELETLPSFKKVDPIYDNAYSYTGMVIKLRRNSLGELFSGYYFPTGSFALLSIISFLIKPDMVRINYNLDCEKFAFFCSKQ